MNKALVLLEALEGISLKIVSEDWEGDEETLVQNILTVADDTVNMVGGREEVDFLYEDLRCKAIDLDVALDYFKDYGEPDTPMAERLISNIAAVLLAIDDLTDRRVSGA